MEQKYPLSIRILHWLIAVFIIGLLIVGLIMTGMDKDNPMHKLLVPLHKSFGLTVLALAFVRVVIRIVSPIPPLPKEISLVERILAQLGHYALYGFMFLLPLSGYIMSVSYGLPVKWFGLALPRMVSVDKDRGELAWDIHSYGAYALIGLLALHTGAVILHYAKQRINLLKRMI